MMSPISLQRPKLLNWMKEGVLIESYSTGLDQISFPVAPRFFFPEQGFWCSGKRTRERKCRRNRVKEVWIGHFFEEVDVLHVLVASLFCRLWILLDIFVGKKPDCFTYFCLFCCWGLMKTLAFKTLLGQDPHCFKRRLWWLKRNDHMFGHFGQLGFSLDMVTTGMDESWFAAHHHLVRGGTWWGYHPAIDLDRLFRIQFVCASKSVIMSQMHQI